MTTGISIAKNSQYGDELRYEQLSEAISALPPEEGIRHLKSFLATYPSFAAAHNDLGVLYLRAGNGTLALAHHEKATRLQPDNIVFRKNLADFYAVELGWLEDATDIYLEVLRRNPRDIEAMLALGKLGEAMQTKNLEGSPQQPFEPFANQPKLVATAQPDSQRSVDDWYRNALTLLSAGDKDAAVFELKKLLARYPDHALASNDLGILLQQQERYEEARKYLEQAVNIEPKSSLFRKNLADILYLGLGDMEAAMKHYVNILSTTPKDVDTLRAIAHICIDCGKLDDSIVFMERLIEIQPWDQEVLEALRKLKAIVTVPVKSTTELNREVQEHLTAGRIETARDLLISLTGLEPNNAVAHNDLAVVLTKLGQYQQARLSHERAVELDPSNSNFRKNLADLYFACLGMSDEAIYIYLDLLKSTPRDLEVLLNLGHICSRLRRPEEARIFYRRAVELEPWNREAREALQQLPS